MATATRKRKATTAKAPKDEKVTTLALPPGTKPSNVVSRVGWRPDLQHAYVVQENGHRELVVTDSFMLARFKVADGTPLGPIHVEALKRVEKGEAHVLLDDGKVSLTLDGETTVVYSVPVTTRLAPYEKPLELSWPEDQTVRIALNPDLLRRLAEAIGSQKSVALDIVVNEERTTLKPIRVTATDHRDGDPEGVLMPIRRV